MLSEQMKSRLHHAGLNSDEVDLLHQALQRAEHLSLKLDASRCTRSLLHAAQGGDSLALKLSCLPSSDPSLRQAVLAYGHLHAPQ